MRILLQALLGQLALFSREPACKPSFGGSIPFRTASLTYMNFRFVRCPLLQQWHKYSLGDDRLQRLVSCGYHIGPRIKWSENRPERATPGALGLAGK